MTGFLLCPFVSPIHTDSSVCIMLNISRLSRASRQLATPYPQPHAILAPSQAASSQGWSCLSRARLPLTIFLVMASSRPTPMDVHALRTRVRLLKAARELFLNGPHTSVTVEDICLAAGMSKGGFYHHFPDKVAIFLTIALDQLEREATSIAGGGQDISGRGPRTVDKPSPPVTLRPPSGRTKSPANPDSESFLKEGLRMTEPAEGRSLTSPERRGARRLQPISSQPRRFTEPDPSALLVDLWALAPRRRPAVRQVRAVHRRALRQALQSQLGKPSKNSDGGDREAQARTAFLIWIGFLVHRALTREVAIDSRGYKKAAG